MSLNITGIDHVNLQVKNLEESCRFWRNLLGFVELEDIPHQKGKIIGNGSAKLALYEKPGLNKHKKVGFSHLGFHVNNFEEAIGLCEKLNIKIKYNGIVEWPKSKSLYIEDPNGYEIELTDTWGGGL